MTDGIAPKERSRAAALARARRGQRAPREEKRPSPRPSFAIYGIALFIAALSDGFDYVFGWIPIVGDIFDAATLIILLFIFLLRLLFSEAKLRALVPVALIIIACLVEIIPLGDFLPSWAAAVSLSWRHEKTWRRMRRRLERGRRSALARA